MVKKERKFNRSCGFTQEQTAFLDRYSEETKKSVNEIVREAIDIYMEKSMERVESV